VRASARASKRTSAWYARARNRARGEAPRTRATLTLPPCPANPWRAGKKAKAKAKAKGKKAETPETSSRAHWTEEEETALSKYHDRLTKTWNKKEVPDWDAIVRKMIVRRPERAARARKRPAPRSPPPLLVASPRAARPPARVRARAPRAGRRLPGPLDHRGARALHQHVRGRGRLRAARRARRRGGAPGDDVAVFAWTIDAKRRKAGWLSRYRRRA
jgi:hypothetical protein